MKPAVAERHHIPAWLPLNRDQPSVATQWRPLNLDSRRVTDNVLMPFGESKIDSFGPSRTMQRREIVSTMKVLEGDFVYRQEGPHSG